MPWDDSAVLGTTLFNSIVSTSSTRCHNESLSAVRSEYKIKITKLEHIIGSPILTYDIPLEFRTFHQNHIAFVTVQD